MKPVIEANFKPFESVRFRQNASLVSKDQLEQDSIRRFPNTA